MNTNALKPFARQARQLLRKGVENRLRFWGFQPDGRCDAQPELIEGGYILRGQVYPDASVPARWQRLKNRIHSAQSWQGTLEEAAYTWFNRLMAIRILEENGYERPVLRYVAGARQPHILQEAKQGIHTLSKAADIERLRLALSDQNEAEALALLLTDYANRQPTLRAMFDRVDDYMSLLLPINLLDKDGILDLLNGSAAISPDDYRQVELIGWLYQFYISERKDEVFAGFKNGKKARAEDIPAATQIFTPRWIVQYMVENTLGRHWLDAHPDSPLRQEMKYLVEPPQSETPTNIDQQQIFNLSDLSLLDPASGSGHIIVVAFDLLMKIYKEEGYPARQAVQRILTEHLYYLDLDERAIQLTRFALLLKAAQHYPEILKTPPYLGGQGGAMPQSYDFSDEQIHAFLGPEGRPFYLELHTLLGDMQLAHLVGSALVLHLNPDARAHVAKRLQAWQQDTAGFSFAEREVFPRILPFLQVALLLTRQYTAVVANPPYMGSGNMSEELKKYVSKHYPSSKSDLMTVFMEVAQLLTLKNGRIGMINLPSWMFISSFENLRKELLELTTIESLVHLGRGVFGSDFGSVAFVINNNNFNIRLGHYRRLFKEHVKVDTVEEKESRFFNPEFGRFITTQEKFTKIPGSPIVYWISEKMLSVFQTGKLLAKLAPPKQGLITGDNERFLRDWHEISKNKFQTKWFPINKGGLFKKWYGNHENVVDWENDGASIKNFTDEYGKLRSRPQNLEYNFKPSISWSLVTAGSFCARYYPDSFMFNVAGISSFPDAKYIYYILGILNSNIAQKFVDLINPTLNSNVGDIGRVPILEVYSNTVDDVVNRCITVSRHDWDSHETSWNFQTNPLVAQQQSALATAYAAYELQATRDFLTLHAREEELNRIFIGIYGLEDELAPDVALEDITILQEELDRKALTSVDSGRWRVDGLSEDDPSAISLHIDDEPWSAERAPYNLLPFDRAVVMEQLLSWCLGVIMGRYRLDKPGLAIAHPNAEAEEIVPYPVSIPVSLASTPDGNTSNFEQETSNFIIDDDAIVPMMGRFSPFPDDVARQVREVLRYVWGEATLTENLNFLQEALGEDLEEYLTNPKKCWANHVRRYKKKPIYWLFASATGSKAAFKVLVYMHRIDRFTVQRIRTHYLHRHQAYLREEIAKLKAREALLNKEETKRLAKWEQDLLECAAYDEQLKYYANQQIEIDLDDGVTVNLRKFEGVVVGV